MPHPSSAARPKDNSAISLVAAVLASFNLLVFAFSLRSLAFAEPGGFPFMYHAGRLARFDMPHLFSRAAQDLYHPGNMGTGYFMHLPYEALLLAALAWLPQIPAYVVWSIFSLACMLASARMLHRCYPHFSILIGLGFAPVLNMLSDGQDSALVLLIAVYAFILFLNQRDFASGAVLAFAWFKYPLVLPLALIVAARNRRFAAGFAVVTVAVLAFSYLLVGHQGIIDYVQLTRTTDLLESPHILTNIRGILGVATGHEQTIPALVLSLVLVAAAALARLSRPALFCVGTVVAQLTAWHSHFYDAVLLLIPLAWMFQSEVPWQRWSAIFALCAAPVLILLPMQRYLLAYFMLAWLIALAATRSGRKLVAAE